MSDIKLINLRGRVITVAPQDVQLLLKRGFVHVPEDQPEMTYSQVHDRGDNTKEPPVEKGQRGKKRAIVHMGDSLKAEQI